jgi:hypothetical protein
VDKFFIEMLVAIPVLFLWLTVVALIVRPFGVRLPWRVFNFGKRSCAAPDLPFFQYVLVYGVLGFGCGMLILTTLSDYLEWKYWHGPFNGLTADKLLGYAVQWPLLAGVLFGLISWGTRSGKSN